MPLHQQPRIPVFNKQTIMEKEICYKKKIYGYNSDDDEDWEWKEIRTIASFDIIRAFEQEKELVVVQKKKKLGRCVIM
uniref:Uncharacterized protein n=1 Tax=Caenorhabditis japonica TaxID=281687 RepID=A0A8R1J297_CAEJA